MTARALIKNLEPKGGESLTVQVDGHPEEVLLPGDEMTIAVDSGEEALISITNGKD